MGGKLESDSVGIFIAEKWVDSVVNVERHSERILILKMVLDTGILFGGNTEYLIGDMSP